MTCSPTARWSVASSRRTPRACPSYLGLVDHIHLAGDAGVTNGTAATREEAMAKCQASWEKAGT